MRILLVNQYYWPDLASTGQHLTDLAEHLAAAGHEVRVLCSAGRYLGGSAALPRAQQHRGVRIERVRGTRLGQRGSRAARIVDYAAFHLAAARRVALDRWPDVTVTLTTPPLLSLWGGLGQRLGRSRHVHFVMDLHPDAEFAAGMLSPHSVLGRTLDSLAAWSMRNATLNVCLGPYQAARVAAKGVAEAAIAQVPVWSDGAELAATPEDTAAVRTARGWEGRFVVMYSGNAGLVHRFGELLEAARRLEHAAPEVLFCFQGSGPRRAEIEAYVERHGLGNVELRPYVERSELAATLLAADCHAMSLEPGQTGIAVPGKLQGILAVGRAVLFVGAERCESADWIRAAEAGACFGPGDAAGLEAAILEWRRDPEGVARRGRAGRAYFERHFERAVCCEAWRGLLEELVGERRAAELPEREAADPGDAAKAA